ncbi:MAG: PTS sugar transporter subunit IIA [Phycisphaerales bacterium]|nr:PTS sugar transporter subunit IIA [Phycisphaerales bacterium]
MDLTAKDAARMLNLPEEQIYAWVRNGTLPSYRIKDRYRLNRVELLEWAAARDIKVAPEFFRENQETHGDLVLMNSLTRGGVLTDVAGNDKSSVLKEVCARLKLPDHVDRDELHSVLVAREALCSTGIGKGIAIPHPRGPIVLGLTDPHVTLAFLREPIDYQAIDKKPVSLLFVIISTTVHIHLMLLSHLMFALQDVEFRQLLHARAGEETILAKAADIEHRMVQADKAKGGAR